MTKTLDMEQLLTGTQVAEILQVSKQWVYRAARTSQIASVQVGRNVRFRRTDIEAWIEAGGVNEDG